MARWILTLVALLFYSCSAQVTTFTSTFFSTSTICPIPTTCGSSQSTDIVTSTFSQPTPSGSTAPFTIQVVNGDIGIGKRSVAYIGFDGDTAVAVTTLDRAALFLISNGYLISDANYVGTNASAVYSTMRRYTDVSAIVSGWSVDIDLNIRLQGSAFTIGGGNADFCVSSSGSVVIEVNAFASNCSTAGLVAGLGPLITTSTSRLSILTAGPSSPGQSVTSPSSAATSSVALSTTGRTLSPSTSSIATVPSLLATSATTSSYPPSSSSSKAAGAALSSSTVPSGTSTLVSLSSSSRASPSIQTTLDNPTSVSPPASSSPRISTSVAAMTSTTSSGTSMSSTAGQFTTSAVTSGTSSSTTIPPSSSSSVLVTSVSSQVSTSSSSSAAATTSQAFSCGQSISTPSCSTVSGFSVYFYGRCLTENVNNGGTFGSSTTNVFANTDLCTAVSECVSAANYFVKDSFDLHFRISTNVWECVMYFGSNHDGADFNVVDTDIREVYGYSTP